MKLLKINIWYFIVTKSNETKNDFKLFGISNIHKDKMTQLEIGYINKIITVKIRSIPFAERTNIAQY